MSDLVEFLTARLGEDEALARPWVTGHADHWRAFVSGGVGLAQPTSYMVVEDQACGAAEHIARWDPARVLAEVKAKRDIIDLHYDMASNYTNWAFDKDYHACFCHEGINGTWPCETVRAIASIYADHPDFDPAWRT